MHNYMCIMRSYAVMPMTAQIKKETPQDTKIVSYGCEVIARIS